MVFTKRGIDLNDVNVLKRIEKIFPDYFQRFKLPDGAREELIKVYRACRSGKCDKNSFLPSFEENGCVINLLVDLTYPGHIPYRSSKKLKMEKVCRCYI